MAVVEGALLRFHALWAKCGMELDAGMTAAPIFRVPTIARRRSECK